MGLRLIDKYSLLHFAVGIVAYFWSISLFMTIMLHILFECIENTPIGMKLINTYFIGWWPGGKIHPDNLTNMMSDVVFTVFGWLLAWKLNELYR